MQLITRRILQFPPIKIIAGYFFCLGCMFIVKTCIAEPGLYAIMENKMWADTLKDCISFSTLLASYYLFSKYYERSKMTELSVRKIVSEFVLGFSIGFGIISLTIFILSLLGFYKVVYISLENYSIRLFTLLITAALVEDLLIRGLIIRVCENWIGTYLTLIVGIMIETLHIFNPNTGPLSMVMFLGWGFTMTMLYVYSKRIWLPFFFHVGWNFAQPFYGSNLTGLKDMGSIIESEFTGPLLFTGGDMGIEGSIITIIFLYFTGFMLLFLSSKRNKIVRKPLRRTFR
jgi:uncharacterized protein